MTLLSFQPSSSSPTPAFGSGGIRVLLVEDEVDVATELAKGLNSSGISVQIATTIEAAFEAISAWQPQIIVLDQKLGAVDSLPLIPEIRALAGCPVIVLTGKGDPYDKISALENAASDYIDKPARPRELVALIRARVRDANSALAIVPFVRHGDSSARGEAIRGCPGWRLDIMTRHIIRPQGKTVELSGNEIDLFKLLIDAKDQFVSREVAMEKIFGREWHAHDRAIDNLVYQIRRKISKSGDPQYQDSQIITSARNSGYAFVGLPPA